MLSLKHRLELFEETAKTKKLADFAGGFVALIDEFTSSARASLEAGERYTDCYNRYLMGQAGIMAKTLEKGKPCPVCGAADHPCPAVCGESIPDENEVKTLKETADSLFAKQSKLRGALDADFKLGAERGIFEGLSSDKIPAQRDRFADVLDNLSRKSAELSMEYFAESEKIKGIMSDPKAIDDEKYLDGDFIASRLAECEKAVSASEINLAACCDECMRLKAKLPREIANAEVLKSEIARTEDNIKQLESEIAEAENRFAEISKAVNDVGARLNSADENAADFAQKAQTALNEFNALLAEKGFASREEFDGCILSGEDIAKAETEISAYRTQLSDLNTELKILTADCAGLKYADIPALEKAYDEIMLEIKQLDEVKTRLTVRCENNKKQLDRIKAAALAIADDENLFKDIGLLCRLSRGDNNAKISFERYVLGSYFADIIAKSNIWLSELTSGKYRLMHKQDKGKGRGAAGLDLEVFDIHTGKNRHVSTLSGGESFKASLSLALGLADVIQEYSGGVSIDTMFIDEGFGSLDDLSRELAVDSLFELEKTGRLIGVISHVAELRERIAVRLEVTPSAKGSRIAFV